MRKTLIALALAASLAAPLFSQQPSHFIPNLGLAKDEIHKWVGSGEYARECAEVSAKARAYLEQNLVGKTRPGMVLDIDETSLSNYPLMNQEDFGFNQGRFDAWIRKAETPPIESTLELYRYAQSREVACFFITGRVETDRAWTEADLKQGGYSDWDGLYLKPADYKEPSVVAYKSGVRKQLSEQGYQILVNIGDQMSDLEGGYSESVYKLPNPMYFIP